MSFYEGFNGKTKITPGKYKPTSTTPMALVKKAVFTHISSP